MYICSVCGRSNYDKCDCVPVKGKDKWIAKCERTGCMNPAKHHVYALGYIACVCADHYSQSTQADKQAVSVHLYAAG